MFYVSKAIWFALQPSSVVLLALVVGVALLWTRFAKWGRRLAAVAAVLYLVCGWLPLGHWLTIPLEGRFQRPSQAELVDITGIIVLGGGIDTTVSRGRGLTMLNEAAERMTESAALARKLPDARLVFSGGSATFLYDGMSESDAARAFYADLGIAPERITFEDRSRTTAENATFTHDLLAPGGGPVPGRWLLVTSAYHMPRSIGVFRRRGFEVLAWPVDYRTRGRADLWRVFAKPSEGLRRMDMAVHEWVALIAYRLRDETAELLP